MFHVNMVWLYVCMYVLTNTGYTAQEVPADHVDEDIPISKDSTEGGSAQVTIAERLPPYRIPHAHRNAVRD